MKQLSLVIIGILSSFMGFSQDNETVNKQQFSLSGFVKNDLFWDTRQTVAAREGHFLLWPEAIKEDANGKDINAVPNFNYLSLQSRLSFSWKGTEALGAKISAKIESDFFAQNNANINLFRLRHAYVKMNWENTELLVGQYWIPMFTTDCFPGTVSFNTGTPFNPFGRNPQIRVSHKLGDLKLVAVANSQRDYSSRGPSETPGKTDVSGRYLRNSLLPEFTGIINYKTDNFVTAIGGAFKQIVPQIETVIDGETKGLATDKKLSSYSAFAFAKLKTSDITFKVKGTYGQNTPDYLNISGFGVTSYDSTTGYQEYAPISNYAAWTDISTNGKEWQVGLFAGYTESLGTKSDIVKNSDGFNSVYGLGVVQKEKDNKRTDPIANLYRISPRLVYNTEKMRFSSELEYTVANYGTTVDAKNVALTTEGVANFRVLFGVYYFFNTKFSKK